MSSKIILLVAILIALFVETTIIPFPLAFIFLVILYTFFPESWVVILAFIVGLVLDSLRLTPIGLTTFITLLTFGIVDLIKKFTPLKDIRILIGFLLISSFVFANIFSYDTSFLIYLLVYGCAEMVAAMLYRKRLIW